MRTVLFLYFESTSHLMTFYSWCLCQQWRFGQVALLRFQQRKGTFPHSSQRENMGPRKSCWPESWSCSASSAMRKITMPSASLGTAPGNHRKSSLWITIRHHKKLEYKWTKKLIPCVNLVHANVFFQQNCKRFKIIRARERKETNSEHPCESNCRKLFQASLLCTDGTWFGWPTLPKRTKPS